MFNILTFKSYGAFWPLAERSQAEDSAGQSTLRGKFTALVERLWSEHTARQAMYELEALDDRTLKDIGITRGEIWHVVRYGRDAAQGEILDIARWS
jgi:uncharacterized protein YjiS (DUF1127 family)